MANLITFVRILCAAVLAFLPAFSPSFYALYLLAGVSDMLDGFVARRTNTVSSLGAKLDTLADIAFPPSAWSGCCLCLRCRFGSAPGLP